LAKELAEELNTLIWVTKGDEIVQPKKEHPSLSNHLCDAFLYMWRNGYHYNSEGVVKKAAIGSQDWYKEQSENIWEREAENIRRSESNGEDSWPEDPAFTPDFNTSWSTSRPEIPPPPASNQPQPGVGNYLKPWNNAPAPIQHWSANRPKLPKP
jgi:hypothetical protein